VGNKASDTFAFDLENRLDDFFNDPAPAEGSTSDEDSASEALDSDPDTSLKALKSTILAIDWEITDDGLDAFIGQVNDLSEVCKQDRIKLTLLKLLKALGKYMRKRKSAAHPDSIKRIMAVYSALEEIVDNRGLTDLEKKKILREEVKQFEQLKQKISEGRLAAGQPPKPAATAATTDLDTVMQAIDALKTSIAKELGAIRKAIATLNQK
jgi:hypothetical protein